MQLDIYQSETAAHAAKQDLILQEARQNLALAGRLSALEFSGTVHALQVLVENAIGKSKLWLKALSLPVPVSAYDAFALLQQRHLITPDDLTAWQRAIGLRNRIVHDYLNLNDAVIYQLIQADAHRFMIDFLNRPIETNHQDGEESHPSQ